MFTSLFSIVNDCSFNMYLKHLSKCLFIINSLGFGFRAKEGADGPPSGQVAHSSLHSHQPLR